MSNHINFDTLQAAYAPITSDTLSNIIYWMTVIVGLIFFFGIIRLINCIYMDWCLKGKGLMSLFHIIRREWWWVCTASIGMVVAINMMVFKL